MALNATSGGTYFGDSSPADLAPGEDGQLLIGMRDDCYPYRETNFAGLQVALPNGRGALVIRPFVESCDVVDVSSMGKPQVPLPDPSPSPGTPNALQASADLGRQVTATAGGELDFIVTVTNPSDVSIPLSPCPSYEFLFNGAATTRYLNCDHVTAIPAEASVRYAMRFTIPANAKRDNKFGWILNTPYPQPGAGSVIVTPNTAR